MKSLKRRFNFLFGSLLLIQFIFDSWSNILFVFNNLTLKIFFNSFLFCFLPYYFLVRIFLCYRFNLWLEFFFCFEALTFSLDFVLSFVKIPKDIFFLPKILMQLIESLILILQRNFINNSRFDIGFKANFQEFCFLPYFFLIRIFLCYRFNLWLEFFFCFTLKFHLNFCFNFIFDFHLDLIFCFEALTFSLDFVLSFVKIPKDIFFLPKILMQLIESLILILQRNFINNSRFDIGFKANFQEE